MYIFTTLHNLLRLIKMNKPCWFCQCCRAKFSNKMAEMLGAKPFTRWQPTIQKYCLHEVISHVTTYPVFQLTPASPNHIKILLPNLTPFIKAIYIPLQLLTIIFNIINLPLYNWARHSWRVKNINATSTDPCGKPNVTGTHSDMEPSSTTLLKSTGLLSNRLVIFSEYQKPGCSFEEKLANQLSNLIGVWRTRKKSFSSC